MSNSFSIFTSSLIVAAAVMAPISMSKGQDEARASQEAIASPRLLYPNNIVCKSFEKTGSQAWRLRDRLTLDLGNWDGAFPQTGECCARKLLAYIAVEHGV